MADSTTTSSSATAAANEATQPQPQLQQSSTTTTTDETDPSSFTTNATTTAPSTVAAPDSSSSLSSSSTAAPPTTSDSDPTDYLLTYLSSTRKLDTLHSSLFNTLSRLGWTHRVRGFATELIRSQTCTRFEQVVDRVVEAATTSEGANPTEEDGENGEGEAGDGETAVNVNGDRKGKRKRDDDEGGLANGADGGTAGPAKRKKARTDTQSSKDSGKNKTNDSNASASKRAGKPATTSTSTTLANGNNTSHDDLSAHDVRIPSAVVSQGVKFLRDTLDDLYVWGGDDLDGDTYRPNGHAHDGDSDVGEGAGEAADDIHDEDAAGEAVDEKVQGEGEDTHAAATAAEQKSSNAMERDKAGENNKTKTKKKG